MYRLVLCLKSRAQSVCVCGRGGLKANFLYRWNHDLLIILPDLKQESICALIALRERVIKMSCAAS